MRKYINPIPDGGAPLHNNRLFTELNLEIWDAMQAILKESAGVTNMIVSGCAVTGGGPFNIAAGIVYVNGEFLRFAGAAGVTLPYYISTAADNVIQKVFSDSVSRNLIVEKLAQGATVDPGGQRVAIIAGQRMPSLREYLHLKADVINALNNTTTDQALSAAQGKVLKDNADAEITNRIADVDAEETARINADNLRVLKTLTVSAGDGMTGGGDLSANRTLAVDGSVCRDALTDSVSGDCDNIAPGTQMIQGNITHGPTATTDRFFLLTTGLNSFGGVNTRKCQIATQISGAGSGDIYMREYAIGSWGAWSNINT